MEVTSLKQVDAIKDRGIFKIGNSGKVAAGKHQLVRKYFWQCFDFQTLQR